MRPRLVRISAANDEFQLAVSLLDNRRQRQRQRRFVVEGVRSIDQAVAHGWPIESFWYPAGRPLSRWATSLLERGLAPRHFEVAPELMGELSGKDEASELLALVEMPKDDLTRIPRHSSLLLVAFDRPVSPGNLGSVIRSADALGADGILATGHAADVYEPQAVRASMGSLFALPVVREGSMEAVRSWLGTIRAETPGFQVVGTSARASTPLGDVDLTRPTVLALGNETKGLSHGWRELCDHLVSIPMTGTADSLNVAAAASILLYEAGRQRSTGSAA